MVVGTRMTGDEPAGDEAGLPGWEQIVAVGDGAYVNLLDTASPADTLACYRAATRERLQATKRSCDPDDVFRRAIAVSA